MIPSFLPMKPPNMRSFPLLPLLLIFSLFFTTTLAIQKSLAGVIDWHTKLLGIPRMDLPPTFHNVSFGAAGEKEVVVSVTNQGVLGMLDAEDGSISECTHCGMTIGSLTGSSTISISYKQSGVLLFPPQPSF